MEISVILPAYNEEQIIERTIYEVVAVVGSVSPNFELIIVDDGSEDNTYEKAKFLSKKFKNIKVLRYSENKGKGYAIRYGIKHSHGKFVVFYDADLEIHPSALLRVIKELKNGPKVIIGSKYTLGSSVEYSKIRKILSMIYRVLNIFLFDLRLRDTQAGIKGFRRDVLLGLMDSMDIKVDGYAFDVALLVSAIEMGIPIKEIPIKVKHDLKNSKIRLRNIGKMLIDDVRLFLSKEKKIKHSKGQNYQLNVHAS